MPEKPSTAQQDIQSLLLDCIVYKNHVEAAYDFAEETYLILKRGIEDDRPDYRNAALVMFDHLLEVRLEEALVGASTLSETAEALQQA